MKPSDSLTELSEAHPKPLENRSKLSESHPNLSDERSNVLESYPKAQFDKFIDIKSEKTAAYNCLENEIY